MAALLGWLAVGEIVVALVVVVRLILGPTVSDRVVAINTVATQGTLALLLFSAAAGRSPEADVALWLASFSYLGTIVWSRYLERDLL